MRMADGMFHKSIIACLVWSLAATSSKGLAQELQAPVPIQQQTTTAPQSQSRKSDDPTAKPALEDALSKTNSQSTQPGSSQSESDRPDSAAKPVGTAVAPSGIINGATATSPAGAAIAPAKQRRARSILIKVGVVIAAGVAIGTVAALSHASPGAAH